MYNIITTYPHLYIYVYAVVFLASLVLLSAYLGIKDMTLTEKVTMTVICGLITSIWPLLAFFGVIASPFVIIGAILHQFTKEK